MDATALAASTTSRLVRAAAELGDRIWDEPSATGGDEIAQLIRLLAPRLVRCGGVAAASLPAGHLSEAAVVRAVNGVVADPTDTAAEAALAVAVSRLLAADPELSIQIARLVRRSFPASVGAPTGAPLPAGLDGEADSLSSRARWASELGAGFARIGQWEQAATATEAAAELFRTLSASDPGFLPDLAYATNSLGNCLAELDRRQEALAATWEAVAVYRQLADFEPVVYLPALASALNNLGMDFSAVARADEALAASQEAVQIRRRLAETDDSYLPELALLLNNLGNHLSEAGRWEQALAPTAEATGITNSCACSAGCWGSRASRSRMPPTCRSCSSGCPPIDWC